MRLEAKDKTCNRITLVLHWFQLEVSMTQKNFETEMCSRCQGTGKYSFCERYRDVCFKCAGAKVVYSKRGLAAKRYFDGLCTVAAKDLKVGDRIRTDGMTNGGASYSYTATITAIDTNGGGEVICNGVAYTLLRIELESPKFGKSGLCTYPHHTFLTRNDDRKEKFEQALAYQETLTKRGTPRKRKAA